jgi:[ribosomal protein S18]-alanine N-acetyltransferase
VRRATLNDIPAMIALDRQTPNAAHWSQLQYEARVAAERLPMAEPLALVAEETFDPDARTTTSSPAILGFLIAHRADKEWELENIVVAENLRRRGIGSLLARRLIAHVRSEMGRDIFLEVRESNDEARALYRKLDFEETGRRKDYYSNPLEDGIICRIKL